MPMPFRDYGNNPSMLVEDTIKVMKNADVFNDDSYYNAFRQQMTQISARLTEIPEYPIKSARLIPFETGLDPTAEYFTRRIIRKTASVAAISPHAEESLPVANAMENQITQTYRDYGSSWVWTWKDVEATSRGIPIPMKARQAAIEAIYNYTDRIAWLGDSDYGLWGLLTYPGVPEVVIPSGASNDITFEGKTPLEQYETLVFLVNSVLNQTNNLERPDTILMDGESYNTVTSTIMDVQNTVSVIQTFRANFPGIWIEDINYMGGVDAPEGRRQIMAYTRSADRVTQKVPLPFRVMPPQVKSFSTQFPVMCKLGGVDFERPYSAVRGYLT